MSERVSEKIEKIRNEKKKREIEQMRPKLVHKLNYKLIRSSTY